MPTKLLFVFLIALLPFQFACSISGKVSDADFTQPPPGSHPEISGGDFCGVQFGESEKGRAFPKSDSADSAREIWKALGSISPSVSVKGGDSFELRSTKDRFLIWILQGECSPEFIQRPTKNQGGNFRFGGSCAEQLYEKMGGELSRRLGGNSKSVANLTCNKGFGSRMIAFFNCTLTDVTGSCVSK